MKPQPKTITRPVRRITARRAIAIATPLSLIAASFVPLLATGASAASKNCKTQKDGAVFITASCRDPLLDKPFVDKTKKETTRGDGVKVHYTYIHGGFKGTDSKFALYFPSKKKYEGRFFQGTYPTVTAEGTPKGDPTNVLGGDTPDDIAFAISHGAYVVSDNNNGGVGAPPDLGAYRLNAAAAKFSETYAKKLYGKSAKTRGYIYGGSGGAYQTLGAAENSDGVWAGEVPMVPGTPNSITSNFNTVDLALRVLKPVLPQIADAEEPGGSGDPYAGLTTEQAAVLHETTSLGMPLGAWFQYKYLEKNESIFSSFDSLIQQLDPDYLTNFYTLPGYAGSDPDVQAALTQDNTTIASVDGKPITGITVADAPTGEVAHELVDVTGGDEAGASFAIGSISGDKITFAPGFTKAFAKGLAVGDAVDIDNNAYIADQYFPRYQVPDKSMYAWNQYRDPTTGDPIYPQESSLISSTFDNAAGGSIQNGNFHGKMIMLGSGFDYQAFPWSADWYHQTAIAVHGNSYMAKNYRIWYQANTPHGATTPADVTHEVNYGGEMQQALLDLDSWVKTGKKPPVSSDYSISSDTQLQLPANANKRGGVQPVVTLAAKASGVTPSDSITVPSGTPVTLTAAAKGPNGVDKIVSADWSWSDAAKYTQTTTVKHPKVSESLTATHTYTKPGTYFATVRVTANKPGSTTTPWADIQNVARVRIVVS